MAEINKLWWRGCAGENLCSAEYKVCSIHHLKWWSLSRVKGYKAMDDALADSLLLVLRNM